MQAEEDEKAEKQASKRQKRKGETPPMRRPAAAPKAAQRRQKAETTPEPSEPAPKRKSRAKAAAEPKPSPAAKKAAKKKQAEVAEPVESVAMSDKEKRRVKAKEAWEKLNDEKVAGLELPSNLGGRISFTVRDPRSKGSSVGVLLATSSFYVSKAMPPDQWPRDCNHLKVRFGVVV